MEIIKTCYNNDKLCCDSYMYTKKLTTATYIRWGCVKQKSFACPGAVSTNVKATKLIGSSVPHNHSSSLAEINVAKAKIKVRDKALNTNENPTQIIAECLMSETDEVISGFGRLDSCVRSIRRQRSVVPKNDKTRLETNKKSNLKSKNTDSSINEEESIMIQRKRKRIQNRLDDSKGIVPGEDSTPCCLRVENVLPHLKANNKHIDETLSTNSCVDYNADKIGTFFRNCGVRCKNLPPRTRAYLKLQISQLFFNAENHVLTSENKDSVCYVDIPHFDHDEDVKSTNISSNFCLALVEEDLKQCIS